MKCHEVSCDVMSRVAAPPPPPPASPKLRLFASLLSSLHRVLFPCHRRPVTAGGSLFRAFRMRAPLAPARISCARWRTHAQGKRRAHFSCPFHRDFRAGAKQEAKRPRKCHSLVTHSNTDIRWSSLMREKIWIEELIAIFGRGRRKFHNMPCDVMRPPARPVFVTDCSPRESRNPAPPQRRLAGRRTSRRREPAAGERHRGPLRHARGPRP